MNIIYLPDFRFLAEYGITSGIDPHNENLPAYYNKHNHCFLERSPDGWILSDPLEQVQYVILSNIGGSGDARTYEELKELMEAINEDRERYTVKGRVVYEALRPIKTRCDTYCPSCDLHIVADKETVPLCPECGHDTEESIQCAVKKYNKD